MALACLFVFTLSRLPLAAAPAASQAVQTPDGAPARVMGAAAPIALAETLDSHEIVGAVQVTPESTPTHTRPLAQAPAITPSSEGQARPPVAPLTPLPSAPPAARVLAIGDSVILAASQQLQKAIPGIQVDAVIGRRVSTAIEVLRSRRDAGQLADLVIVHIGNNGGIGPEQLEEIMQVLAEVPRIIFVNLKTPSEFETASNETLAAGARRYSQALLVNWYAASAERPELFWNDGLHIRPEGARVYAALVAAALTKVQPV